MKAPSLTIGIEEEYQVVDPETRELCSLRSDLLEDTAFTRGEIKPELHQSTIEVGTAVCDDPAAARRELVRLRRLAMDLVARQGLTIVAGGTHPLSSWLRQTVTPLPRYATITDDLQEAARRLLIYGTHVHIGVEDRDVLVDIFNSARYYLPHLLALSTSSPFWMGRNTGLHSYRSVVFREFPRTGIPRQLESWAHFARTVETLVATHCIPDGSKIWWDMRPSWHYPTIEFRICDGCPRLDDAVAIGALVQALVWKLWRLRRDNLSFHRYPTVLIEENKWRAARYGIEGELIDFGRLVEVPAREAIRTFIEEFLGDTLDELGTRAQAEPALRILREGTSAQRQLDVWAATGDMHAVVDQLIRETAEGVTSWPAVAGREEALPAAAPRGDLRLPSEEALDGPAPPAPRPGASHVPPPAA